MIIIIFERGGGIRFLGLQAKKKGGVGWGGVGWGGVGWGGVGWEEDILCRLSGTRDRR